MALKVVVIAWLISNGVALSAQNLSLSVFDFHWTGDDFSLSNEVAADSAALIAEAISFHPTEPILYYSKKDGSRWQIVSFNYQSGENKVVIESTEDLADPRLTPDKKYLSCIFGDKQEVRKFSLTTGEWHSVYADARVDRHVWMDDNALLLISPGQPNQLQLVTLRPKKSIPVALNVGPEIQQSKDVLAFVHKLSVDSWSIKRINKDGSIEIMAETLPEADLFALLPEGRIIMLSEDHVFGYMPSTQWREFPIDNARREATIKSLGVSPGGDKLFVLFATPKP